MKNKIPETKTDLLNLINIEVENNGFSCDLNHINISKIDDISYIFSDINSYLHKFNGDISKWDVSKVKNMEGLFEGSEFNGDISQWDVKNVKHMSYMFLNSKFNGDLNSWQPINLLEKNHIFKKSKLKKEKKEPYWSKVPIEKLKEIVENYSLYNILNKNLNNSLNNQKRKKI